MQAGTVCMVEWAGVRGGAAGPWGGVRGGAAGPWGGVGAHFDCPLVPSRLVERFGNF